MGKRHDIKLLGPAVQADRISGPLLHELLHVIVEGTQRAVRLLLDGKSRARGTQPAWLRPASQFDVVTPQTAGPGTVRIESRRLSELVPDTAGVRALLAGLGAETTGLDLFEDALEDALAGTADSDRFDEGLVETFSELSRLFEDGVEAVEILNGRTISVLPEGLERVRQLRRQTPPPQAVRIAGKLDAIRHSDRMFTLVLDEGVVLRGYAERAAPGQLAALFGKAVAVSGTAVFRPSGTVLRVDAEQLEPIAPEQVRLWSKVPKPLLAPLDIRALHEAQGPRTGINALLGQWPGDESDEEIRVALESMS
jgi:hypothetical protein